MRIDRPKGAQVGDGNVQHNTYVPPQAGPRHRSPSMSVSAGDHAHVTQKNTSLKFSIPVVGPLLALAAAHPVVAAGAAALVLGGGGLAANAALSDSGSGASTALVRGFTLKNSPDGASTGYDFSHTPPVVADTATDAIYMSGSLLVATNGKLAQWNTSELPTGDDCRALLAEQPVRSVPVGPQTVVCYLDRNGDPGYISVTSSDIEATTVDTAHLR
ncbi:hypothetical protein [Streptomyces fructofermentans]|uniref:Uncharacterized protein n=1 Tax=Streptomyces fructofermentans TaxID=152141 RepID=A0A918U3B0_9ACTN|nr:hypothetical protein [Streptomyces fructofermentans]GGX84754.1 hypothetical protein GCM10010515_60180 [Streptomyces fructofermentans]